MLVAAAFAMIAFARASMSADARSGRGIMQAGGVGLLVIGGLFLIGSTMVVIEPGQVGVRHAFGVVDGEPLFPGIRFVSPWSIVERFSTREEQFPEAGEGVEDISALSSEQMGMTLDVALRWQIDPMAAPRIFMEIGGEDQIHVAVRNAIRNGVRDGMVQFSINDISRRNVIASTMEAEVDSALVTQPRAGDGPFRIASVTAFFLRDLQPPEQVIQAINAKIAQEQQIQTERHRVEVARLQAEQQRLLNQTLTAEALTKQYLEVLHDLRGSNNSIILVPTEGGLPILNLGDLRRNLQSQR
jgi:regulator of protease activity HflC (stomatin/prohibitin superfamily)